MTGYVCSVCNGTMFSYVMKDAAHIGLYCDNCGKWLKWAGKKEYANKSILPYDVFMNQMAKHKKEDTNNVSMSQVDVTKKESVCQHISNGYEQSTENTMGTAVQTVEPAMCAEMSAGGSGALTHTLSINPKGAAVLTIDGGEPVTLQNIFIVIKKDVVSIKDVTGEEIRTLRF